MIRPLDMQVAFNAIPEFAKQTGGEQAGALYRQVQDSNRARDENLLRPEKITETQHGSDAVFRPIQPRQDQPGRGGSRSGSRDRSESSAPREQQVYGPRGARSFARAMYEEGAGLQLDLSA